MNDIINRLENVAITMNEESYHVEEAELRGVIRQLACLPGFSSTPNKLEILIKELRQEMKKAVAQHGPFPTCHHGHSVILEEVDELFAEIKANRGDLGPARREAIQIATVAIRYAFDLCFHEDPQARLPIEETLGPASGSQSQGGNPV